MASTVPAALADLPALLSFGLVGIDDTLRVWLTADPEPGSGQLLHSRPNCGGPLAAPTLPAALWPVRGVLEHLHSGELCPCVEAPDPGSTLDEERFLVDASMRDTASFVTQGAPAGRYLGPGGTFSDPNALATSVLGKLRTKIAMTRYTLGFGADNDWHAARENLTVRAEELLSSASYRLESRFDTARGAFVMLTASGEHKFVGLLETIDLGVTLDDIDITGGTRGSGFSDAADKVNRVPVWMTTRLVSVANRDRFLAYAETVLMPPKDLRRAADYELLVKISLPLAAVCMASDAKFLCLDDGYTDEEMLAAYKLSVRDGGVVGFADILEALIAA